MNRERTPLRVSGRSKRAVFFNGASRLIDPMTRRNNYPEYRLRKPSDAIRSYWLAVGEYLESGIAQYEKLHPQETDD